MSNQQLIVFIYVCLHWIAGGVTAAAGQAPDPFIASGQLDRELVVRTVLERNPTIEAAREAWQAALQREPQARSLEDPTLSYSFAPLSIGADDVRYGQVIRFTQRLPFPGIRTLRGEVARAEADAARNDAQRVRLRLANVASNLFYDIYFVYRAIDINAEHVRLLEDYKRVATARYVAGEAAHQDPLQAEVELAHALHRNVVLSTTRDTVTAQLNMLLRRRPEAPLPGPPRRLPYPAMAAFHVPDTAQLQDAALRARPEFRARLAEIDARRSEVKLRERESYPDFVASTGYDSMWAATEHRWSVGLGVNIPIGRDRGASVAEAQVRVRRAERKLDELEDLIRAEVHHARIRLTEAAHVVELYDSRLRPAVVDHTRAALAGFETGLSSFLALIDAERNQLTVELGYEEAIAEFHRREAELDRSVGRIPGVPDETNGELP